MAGKLSSRTSQHTASEVRAPFARTTAFREGKMEIRKEQKAEILNRIAERKKGKKGCGEGRIYFKDDGFTLWIDYYDASGRQRRESVAPELRALSLAGRKNLDPLKVAEQLLRKRIGAKDNGILPSPKKARVTVSELYEYKLAQLQSKRKPRTVSWFKARWELRLKDRFGPRKASTVCRADLEAYQAERMAYYREKYPSATPRKIAACENAVNGDLAALRMMFRFAKRLEKIDIVPSFPEEFEGAQEREGTVTDEQFRAMLDHCKPDETWLRTFLTMAYTWGYRVMELLNLQCGRVNLKERTVYLPPRSTKNKKPRMVPISDKEVPLLLDCIEGKAVEDFVFTRKNGKRVLDFRERWEQLVEAAKAGHTEIGLGKRTWIPAIPHDLRRTAVSRMLSGGMGAESVRAIVGHLTPEMTQKYYRPGIDTLRRLQQAAEANLGTLTELPRLTFKADSRPNKESEANGKP